MNANSEDTNIYIAELKSLLKDKFFMLLLGISVSIVILSTVYSFLKPKSEGQVASGAQTNAQEESIATAQTEPTAFLDEQEGIEGLEPVVKEEQKTSFFESLKQKTQDFFGASAKPSSPEASVSPAQGSEGTANESSSFKPGSVYVVQEGDDLWNIAEKTYNSGYNYVDLVSANNIMYADYIEVGQKINLPKVEPKMPTTGEISPEAASTKSESSIPATYTALEGDCLWNIAITQYNDGYMWTRIAQLNNLPDPDFIMVGQVLKLK